MCDSKIELWDNTHDEQHPQQLKGRGSYDYCAKSVRLEQEMTFTLSCDRPVPMTF